MLTLALGAQGGPHDLAVALAIAGDLLPGRLDVVHEVGVHVGAHVLDGGVDGAVHGVGEVLLRRAPNQKDRERRGSIVGSGEAQPNDKVVVLMAQQQGESNSQQFSAIQGLACERSTSI